MTDDEQTDPENAVDAGDEETVDAPSDAGAADEARAAAEEASESQIEDVKAGEDPPKALATPHGHEGDYDPVAEAEDLPEPPPEAESEGDDSAADGPLDLGDDTGEAAGDGDAEPPDAGDEPADGGEADAGGAEDAQ
ncbi:MAG: hypothetical protein QOG56_2541 [Solirubrobacteraceae bacterium]|jgi:hypothetical protein|nr:hypothetical protein [Solirubrobacteraceae bacterium]